MKCFNHPNTDAVATCSGCGVGLCRECAQKHHRKICDECFEKSKLNNKIDTVAELIKIIVISVVSGMIFNHFLSADSDIYSFYVGAVIPWGWITLNKLTPNIFLFLPIIGWVIYFVVKLMLSIIVGVVAMPIQIFKTILHFVKVQNVE